MSATVTELRPADQARPARYDSHDAKRAALDKIDADAKAHRDARTLIPQGERIIIAARAQLRREGLPCMFIPADPAVSERINEAVAKVSGAGFVANLRDLVGTDSSRDWSDASAALDALVDLLRPYASEPLQYVGNAGLAVQAAAAMGKHDVADAKRVAAEVKRLMAAIKKAERKAAGPRRAAAKAKAAPIVAPTPEPNEEESVPMTDETGAPPASPLDAAVLAHRANPCDETRSALMAEQEAHTDGFYRRVADECLAQQAAPAPAPVVAPVVHAPAAPAPAATIPQPLADYLARLVNGAKLTYAAALVAHLFTGAERPEMPSADWAPKVLAKVEKYSGRKVGR